MFDFSVFTNAEWVAIGLSLKVSLLCALLSLCPAMAIAYAMARYDFRGKSLIEGFIHLPLVMPPVTTGYLLLLLLGTRSFVGNWLLHTFGIRLAFSFYSAVIAAIVVSFPLMVRSMRTALEMVDSGLEDASQILGVGKIRTFFNVTAPLALPGILSGGILSFARSLGEFGATISFAGNIAGETRTLPLAIYAYMQIPGRENATIRLVMVSVLISFLAMAVSEWYLRRMKTARRHT